MKKATIISTVILLMITLVTAEAQTVILINGQPTKVILKGKEIQEIVNANIQNYLQSFESDLYQRKTVMQPAKLSHINMAIVDNSPTIKNE